MKTKILIIGFGDMAERIAVLLVASGQVSNLVIASRNAEKGETAARLLGASFPCRVAFHALDATDQSAVERLITSEEPDLILQNASLMGPFVLVGREDAVAKAFSRVGRGPTLPVQLTVLLSVMKAVRAIGFDRPVANLSFPDVTNPILATAGLAPTIGLGNAAMIQYRVRQALLLHNDIDPNEVPLIRVVAHHAQVPIAMRSQMPSDPQDRCWVFLGERAERNDELAYAAPGIAPGRHYNMPTAACCVAALLALLPGAHPLRMSLPAPDGLPGGYPCVVRDGGVSLDLPMGLSLQECLDFQHRMARLDGIENIDGNGTVTFTSDVMDALGPIDPVLAEPLGLGQIEERYERLRDVLNP